MRRLQVSSMAAVVALACATTFAGPAHAGPTLKLEDYDPACVATVIPDWSKVQGWSPERIEELIAQRCLPLATAIEFTAFDPVNNSDDNNLTVHVVGNDPASGGPPGNGPDNGGNNGPCGGSCGIGNDGNGTGNESGTGGNSGGNHDRNNGNGSGENGSNKEN